MSKKDSLPSASRIRVHDSALYTQLMAASDWTDSPYRVPHTDAVHTDAVHSDVTTANTVAPRGAHFTAAEGLSSPDAHWLSAAQTRLSRDAAAASAARRRAAAEASESRAYEHFLRRVDGVSASSNAMAQRCAVVSQREALKAARVREGIARTWEATVAQPTNARIAQGLQKVPEATRAEQRQRMWRSYVSECNAKDRLGGGHAVFRDLIDPLRYDPLRQAQEYTVSYVRPRRPLLAVDAHRRDAEAVRRTYDGLALDYRHQQRISATGALAGAAETMPLPLPGVKEAQWLVQRAVPRPREADLPVKKWEKFDETPIGWYATRDGDLKPICERRMYCADMASRSKVMFNDYFVYSPETQEPLHTGKRVV